MDSTWALRMRWPSRKARAFRGLTSTFRHRSSRPKKNANGHIKHHIIYVNQSQTINVLIPTGSSEHYPVHKS